MYRRNIIPRVVAALDDTPVVLLNGARQTGKTTLVQALVAERDGAHYFSLDDLATLAAVAADPSGFLQGLEGLIAIDEVQKAPQLFPAIKREVDRLRRPGRFLLTGSANVLLLPRLSESLAGRMEILTLWPFSQGELLDREEGFIDHLFSDRFPDVGREGPPVEPLEPALRGGFPEALQRSSEERRSAWFGAYITTILQRDVRDLSNIQGLTELPRLLFLLAARTSSLINKAEISRATGLPYATLDRYLALLQMTFLLSPLPAWSGNLGKRLTRSAKLYLCDSGLVAHLLDLSPRRLARDRLLAGPLLENFVITELMKQSTWAKTAVTLHHFRTTAGREVDVILEDRRGRIVGIEIKASATLGNRDFAGLRALSSDLGEKFVRGVVLYTGESIIPYAPTLHALPITAIWKPGLG